MFGDVKIQTSILNLTGYIIYPINPDLLLQAEYSRKKEYRHKY